MDGDVEMRHRGERGGKRYRRQKGLAMGVRDVEMHDAEASLQQDNPDFLDSVRYSFCFSRRHHVTHLTSHILVACCNNAHRSDWVWFWK